MNNNTLNEGKSIDGIKVIIRYMSKYWYMLIFVAIFIVSATWLQIKAPLIMGDAIDNMSQYVGTEIQRNTAEDVYNSVIAGEGISDETLETIESYAEQADTEVDLTAFEQMSNEDLQSYFELMTVQYNMYILDNDAFISGDFTDEQLDYLENTTDIDDQTKAAFSFFTPEQYAQNATIFDTVVIPQTQVDDQYDEFLDTLQLLILSYLALALANFIYNILMARVSALTSRDMRNKLFSKLETLSIKFFDQTNDGDVLSRFTNDIDNINNALNQTLTQVLSQVALLVGVLYSMFKEDTTQGEIFGFTYNNELTWQLIGFSLVAIVLASFIVVKASKYVQKQQSKLGQLNGYIDERISAQKIIITNDLFDETKEGFDEYNSDYRETSFKGQAYSGVIMPMMIGIGLVNLGFLTFTGGKEVVAGTLSVGLLTAFIQYSQRFFQPLGQIFSQYNILQLAISGAARVNQILKVKPDIIESKNAIEITDIKGDVKLENVTFGYYEDQVVLDDVSITVEHGKKVALVGPTGSGKTTVMNLLNRFYDLDSGRILFGDTDIRDITLESLRKNVGIVLQEAVLFQGTIEENIKYGKPEATHDDVISAAKTANIHDFIVSLDDGYETQISNESTLFSVGQKQLMSMARTIITDPDLLILDEATSNVDTVTEAKIQAAMENVMQGRTSFVIAHRLKTIIDSDIIVVLKDGKVLEQGSHEELLEYGGLYSELYHNQFVLD